ncbi:hypothetical protein C3B47_09965 [Flavobacterium columnare]|uniref:hypothetical protein n=1 Tax=Flavobacterium columnare TaxID=996 RepID=UPI0018966AF8|nr:hypothetical protein [Flavobacterium columnare]MBF6653212.1 hypothetical protein [Flavobacterium columnare]
MKKLSFIIGAFLMILNFQTLAQISVSLNIGEQHPNRCANYSEERVQYVYLPELECYYDNFNQVYIYSGPRGWCRSSHLPDYCRGYDIQRAPRVIIDYRGNCPWTSFNDHRKSHWKNNYRNYHSEYYGPAYSRRGNHIAYVNRDNQYYRKNEDRYENRVENRDYYRDQQEYKNNERSYEQGENRAHGRRF